MEISPQEGRKKKADQKRNAKLSPAATLPAHILRLREGSFFKQAKTANEVHRKLQATYHCNPDRVAMALLRLQRRKQLRKASKMVDKKKQLAYVW